MKRTELDWRLYVDESGKFENVSHDVVVAGLLVPGEIAGPAAVRKALQDAAPGIGWPLHASFLDRPVLFALSRCAAVLSPERGSDSEIDRLDRAIADVVRVLSDWEGEKFRASVPLVQRGRLPERSVINALEWVARNEAAGAYAMLEDQITHMWLAIGRAVKSIGLSSGTTERMDPRRSPMALPAAAPHVALFCAGESVRGDAAGETTLAARKIDSARYLHLLEVLFHRVASVVARVPGSHRLWLHVLVRDVFDHQLGRTRPLHSRDIRAIADRVEPHFGGRVRLVTAAIAAFDAQASPGDVFADFISNQTRWMLKSKSARLADVEARIQGRFQAAVRSGAPPLSHLAASGQAARFLRGEVSELPAPGDGMRRWAHEQAVQWAGAQAIAGDAL